MLRLISGTSCRKTGEPGGKPSSSRFAAAWRNRRLRRHSVQAGANGAQRASRGTITRARQLTSSAVDGSQPDVIRLTPPGVFFLSGFIPRTGIFSAPPLAKRTNLAW